MTVRLRVASVLGAAALAALPWQPAAAQDPVAVDQPVTDSFDVLEDPSAVRAAVDEFEDATGRRLFVVTTDEFAPFAPHAWALATADASDLGTSAVVLAVADRGLEYGVYAAVGSIDTASIEAVEDGDLDVVAAIETLRDGADDGPPWALIVPGLLLLLGAFAWAVARWRRRFDHTHHVKDEHGNPIDPADLLSEDELRIHAIEGLVAVDDALYTSDAQLRQLERREPSPALAPLRAIVDDGRVQLAEAFALQSTLDDRGATDAPRTASRIISIVDAIDHALDGAAEAFDAAGRWTPPVKGELKSRAIAAQGEAWAALEAADHSDATAFTDAVAGVIAAHRGVVGVRARTHLAAARRATDVETALAEATSALEYARADLAARSEVKIKASIVGGLLVESTDDLADRFGGSTHGGGSGAPYAGSTKGTPRVPARFGGTGTRGRDDD